MYIVCKRLFQHYIIQDVACYFVVGLILIILHSIMFSKCKPYVFEYHKPLDINKHILFENRSLKYILLWNPNVNPFNYIHDRGRAPFLINKCQYTNCYLTHMRKFFPDQTNFDAVLFSVMSFANNIEIPENRSTNQKFIIAANHPVPNPILDNYFNWTWTYRLDSDILWRQIRIYDKHGNEVGPRKNMTWLKYFEPTSDDVKIKLRRKSKAVAWIVSDLKTKIKLEKQVNRIIKALKVYSHTIDVYGQSFGNSCGNDSSCYKMILDDYFFYLVFENYTDKDYVTEKILMAVHNYAIPIVFGGADYSRFLPPKSYLDARKLHPVRLVNIMIDIMNNYLLHDQYFRWTNHYTYRKADYIEICNICKAINDESMVNEHSIHRNFRAWWRGSMTIQDMIAALYVNDKEFDKAGTNNSQVSKLLKKKYFSRSGNLSVFLYNLSKLITTTDSASDVETTTLNTGDYYDVP